jgi:V8-like Glu-specific endopeptidase
MVSSFHFLTAGHCVNAGAGGGWFSNFQVSPGQDAGSKWYGTAGWTTVRSYQGWTVSGDWDWDFALITLDRPVGTHVGWLGREWNGSDAYYDGLNLNTAGYPGDKPTGTMWYAYGPTDFATTNRLFFNGALDVWNGQSGSSMWRYDGTDRYVNGIITHHAGGGYPDHNSGTRMTETKFNDVGDWIADDTPPAEQPDLTDYDDWFGTDLASFSLDPVKPGQSFSKTAYVQNNGFTSGGYWVDFYASTNDIISTGDDFIGSVFVSSTGSYTFDTAEDTTAFPTIPAGNYYVGWIIDATGAETEYDESNNTGVITSNLLAVLPAAPGSLTATSISTSQINLSWTDVAGETGYKIERSPNGFSGWTQIGTTPANDTTYSSTGLNPGTEYFYRVRAYTTAGDGDYSPTDSAFTYVAAPASLTAIGKWKMITLNWSNVLGETGYKIERSPNGVNGWTQIATVGANVTKYTNTGLSDGTTYFYRVRGYNAAGNGAFSPVDSATTWEFALVGFSPSPPSPPALGPTPASTDGAADVPPVSEIADEGDQPVAVRGFSRSPATMASADDLFALTPWDDPLLMLG